MSVIVFFLVCLNLSANEAGATALKWLHLSETNIELRGLPWFKENTPELWRLPKSSKDKVPRGVWSRAIAPDGGRIRLKCSTSQLAIKIQAVTAKGKPCFVDAYIGREFAGSASVRGTKEQSLLLFTNRNHRVKDITIYLPNNHEVCVSAIGVDEDAKLNKPGEFRLDAPLVCYGSSVLQGTGATHPSKTYPAALARHLNFDFVNLGFGGAGKAEPEVVSVVNQLDACCFIFDLGKSYGSQGEAAYAEMLDTIRSHHPRVPIVCITPIYSIKEQTDPAYHEYSEGLRLLMRNAVLGRRSKGDRQAFLIEGLELFSAADISLFEDPLHPNDEGNERIAGRLASKLRKIIYRSEKR